MGKRLRNWELAGFFWTVLAGTALHFLYDWTGGAAWAAVASAVNESVWEHMKLLFWPMLLYTAVQSFFFRDREDFWCVKARGTFLGLTLIPVLFYTYNGVVGRSPDWLNIAIFFIAAAVAYLHETRLFRKGTARCISPKPAIAALLLTAALFVIFTFAAPTLGIFRDPLTGTYGI